MLFFLLTHNGIFISKGVLPILGKQGFMVLLNKTSHQNPYTCGERGVTLVRVWLNESIT